MTVTFPDKFGEIPIFNPTSRTFATTSSIAFEVIRGRLGSNRHSLHLLRRAILCLTIRIAYKSVFFNRSEFPTTDRELKLIATLAHTGEISKPKIG